MCTTIVATLTNSCCCQTPLTRVLSKHELYAGVDLVVRELLQLNVSLPFNYLFNCQRTISLPSLFCVSLLYHVLISVIVMMS